uniref:Uncharacterized protein n=1 Tax=Anguilla anguilla TaxID=7936 RepID=A0A0E9U7R0_ANGAN
MSRLSRHKELKRVGGARQCSTRK